MHHRASVADEYEQARAGEEGEEPIDVANARRLRDEAPIAVDPQERDQSIAEARAEPPDQLIVDRSPHRIPPLRDVSREGEQIIRFLYEEILPDRFTRRRA